MSDDTQRLPERLAALPAHPTYYQDGREGPDGKWGVSVVSEDGGSYQGRFFTLIRRDTKEEAEAVAGALVRRWNADALLNSAEQQKGIITDVRELVEAVRRLSLKPAMTFLPWDTCAQCGEPWNGRGTRCKPDCFAGILLRKHAHVRVGEELRQLIQSESAR